MFKVGGYGGFAVADLRSGRTGSRIGARDAGEAELRNPVGPPALAGRTIEAEPSNVLRV